MEMHNVGVARFLTISVVIEALSHVFGYEVNKKKKIAFYCTRQLPVGLLPDNEGRNDQLGEKIKYLDIQIIAASNVTDWKILH